MSQANMNNDINDDYSKILSEILNKVFLFEIDNDIYYSKNHLCFQKTDENIFIVGFDSYITNLLSFINAIVLTSINEPIFEGKPFGWLVQNGKTFSIYSPVNAVIYEQNMNIVDKPDSLRNRKFPDNWFVKLKFQDKKDTLKLMQGKIAEIWYERINKKLKNEIINILKESHPKELITQFDGGKFIYSITEILPSNERIKIISDMLLIR